MPQGHTFNEATLDTRHHQRRTLTQPGEIRESLKFEKLPGQSSLKGMTWEGAEGVSTGEEPVLAESGSGT